LIRYRRYLNNSPIADFSFLQDENSTPMKVDFDASLTTDVDGDSLVYFWDFGDGRKAFSLTNKISHAYDSLGEYNVTLKSQDKWNGVSSIHKNMTIKALTGRTKLDNEGLSVYPNPATDSFTIELPNNYRPTSVSVTNLLGQKYLIKIKPGKNLVLTQDWKDSLYVIYFETHAVVQKTKLLVKNNG